MSNSKGVTRHNPPLMKNLVFSSIFYRFTRKPLANAMEDEMAKSSPGQENNPHHVVLNLLSSASYEWLSLTLSAGVLRLAVWQ